MIDALPPTDLYRKLLKILKCGQFIARVYCKWTCSHPPAFGGWLHVHGMHSSSTIFRAGAWWRPVRFTSVPQWTLSSKRLRPGALLLLDGWNTKVNPWMHSNQPDIPQRGVCIRYQSAAVRGDRCANTCIHSWWRCSSAICSNLQCLHNF